MNNNLPELRDIHIPEGVSAFPPAYGWYVLLGTVLLFFLCLHFYLIWRQRSRKRYALKLISELDYTNIIVSAIRTFAQNLYLSLSGCCISERPKVD